MENDIAKTEEDLMIMRKGCSLLAGVMRALGEKIVIGVNGLEIDALAEKMIRDAGCEPAFKGYGGDDGEIPFPATICFSLNEGIVHGIPSERIIRDGDVVKIDIGLRYKGYYADMARTFLVGNVSPQAQKLADVTQKSFFKGIATIKHGSTLVDYAQAVQKYVERNGFSVVKNLVGHGIGKQLHEAPQIPNYVSKKIPNFVFKKGMTVAIEPMVNVGSSETQIASDGWAFETADGSLSAHYENTLLVTAHGVDILTQ
jgi:methionyl aminopeptidase